MPKEEVDSSPHPHIPSLRSGNRDSKPGDIRDWATSVLAFHPSPAAVNEWLIVGMHWCKNGTGVEHEYPTFVARRESIPPVEIYLRLDRRPSPEALQIKKGEALVEPDTYRTLTEKQRQEVLQIVEQERRELLSKRLKGLVQSSKASSGKDGGSDPDDTIMRSRHRHGLVDHDSDLVDVLATYSNFQRPFPIRDLAIIAKIVVDTAGSYLLLTQQCYWFTRTLLGISVAMYHPQPEGIFQETFSRAGRISRLPFIPVINSNNPTEIATLVEQANREIEQDDRKVLADYMRGEGGRIAAEEALALEQEARVREQEELVRERRARIEAETRARELQRLLDLYSHGPC